MRALVVAAALAVPLSVASAGGRMSCLSNDGQVRLDIAGDTVDGVTLRIPPSGDRDAKTWRLSRGDYELEFLSEGQPTVHTEGCAGVPSGTLAILQTSLVSTRRIRLTLPGGALPDSMAGRTPQGDGIERDLTCTEVRTGMAKCP